MMAQSGALFDIIDAGARILESACGPCIGMGQAPNSGGISLRTFNRNFLGRSGTRDAQVYLVSPETAAVSAINGFFSDPRVMGDMPKYIMPEKFLINDNMITPPVSAEKSDEVEVVRGPNIKPFPLNVELGDEITAEVSLKVGDNITTDHIMPAGAKILPLRSNIPAISEYCFEVCDSDFAKRAKDLERSIVVGGSNYGQGSSREHAALAPLYLGVKAVIAKSFARIHRSNLINNGILPLTFIKESDYDKINQGDALELPNIKQIVKSDGIVEIINKTTGEVIKAEAGLSPRARDMILLGGLINLIKSKA